MYVAWLKGCTLLLWLLVGERLGITEVAMYAVIRQYQIPLEAVEAVTRQVCEGFAPFISRVMPGFVEYCWIDAGNGKLISISVYEDRAVAEVSTEMAAADVREHLAGLVPNPPEVLAGEVIVRILGHMGQDST